MENTELIKLEQSVQIVYLNSNLWEMVFKSGEFWSTNPGGTQADNYFQHSEVLEIISWLSPQWCWCNGNNAGLKGEEQQDVLDALSRLVVAVQMQHMPYGILTVVLC